MAAGNMNLGALEGGAGVGDGIQELIKQRLMAQQFLAQQQQQQTDNNFKQQQLQQQDDLKRAQLAEMADAAKSRAAVAQGAQQDRQIGLASGLADQIPPNTFMPMSDPAVGMLRTGGRGSLLTPQPAIDPQGPAFEGPTQPGISQDDMIAGRGPGVLKTASSKQQENAAADARKLAEDAAKQNEQPLVETVSTNGQPVWTPRSEAAGKRSYVKPTAEQTITIQTVDAQGNPITRVVPKSEAVGQDFARPLSGQAASHATANKEALDTLTQLDQAIDAAKDKIGPGAGRVSNIEQMVGSADPTIQALGVKMKAAKMRVDHAVTGSVRAGASPTMMAQWDNILSNKVTPEGLKAGVQAMREVIGGTGAHGGQITVTAPDGSAHAFDTQAQADAFKQLAGIR